MPVDDTPRSPEDEAREANSKRLCYEQFTAGHTLDDLDLRAAAHHAQIVGDRETERKIDSELQSRGQG